MNKDKKFDVIIIGGSYAGLSAAMALGRSLRSVLIIDSGFPCNKQTPHSHNFLLGDGSTPAELTKAAKEQVLKYDTVNFHADRAVKGYRTDYGFAIATQKGDEFESKKLIFATGVRDLLLPIPGFSACWGISIVHCPYCHGYEFRNQKTGIIANGERAAHLVPLVHNLTSDLAILTNGPADLSKELREKAEKYGINIIETEIAEFLHEEGQLRKVVFSDGSDMAFDAVYATVPFEQHSDIPTNLGCKLTEHSHIEVDNFQHTTEPGVFACGDNAGMMRSVSNAVATGNVAGAMVNKELTDGMF
ncbi:NAD(P)/FAD-dependent oxidoreductase [Sphingobacterium shayense]|uniref:NAD(P)/FAD-dependent oxidoreductase n=1 Tax=Sphingobacterium shayense TaxID=626343 RepID=UPI00155569E7|nr:NAD(P)/FAD-dependent oxidoreductase [Sphingobacterium shayense]NQD69402.1 NAD(P)/FAD-dependent oxidoreductase [Sphingobacterium shayense]